MRFDELLTAAPEIAGPIRDRLTATGLGLLGTIRRDGSPRVSPIEVGFLDGLLTMGMMPGSAKSADVARDPRCCLLTPVADTSDLGGEGKLFGRIERLTGDRAEDLLRRMAEGIDGATYEDLAGSPVFHLDVEAAAWQRVDGDSWHTLSWRTGAAVRHRRRDGATGATVDVG